MPNPIRLLVFDLDFLVFDSAALKLRALRESLISFADAIPQYISLPDSEALESSYRNYGSHWARHLEIGLDEKTMHQLEAAYRVHEGRLVDSGAGCIFPGLEQVLLDYRRRGTAHALGATSSRDYLMAVSDRHRLDDIFEIAVCTEEYGAGGSEEMMRDLMRLAEVNPSETLALGTRPSFLQAARNNDVLSVGCGWGLAHPETLEHAEFRCMAVEQLQGVLRSVEAVISRS